MRSLAILTQRNEGAFLLEWIAHHKAVGFSDILVLSNDCQDGSDRMLDRLEDLGHITHLRNDPPYDKSGIQFAALKKADKHRLTRKADWILALDIDEFVNIHTGNGQISDLLEALPDADAVTLTWRLFGNGDTIRYEDRPVTEQFLRCAPEVIHWPWRAAMFKTLYRNNGTYRKTGVHRPRSPADEAALDSYRWFDGSGRELDSSFKTQRVFSNYGQANFDLVQLNHYPLGAMESYVLKADRGRAVHSSDQLGMDYWVERNFNTDEDNSINRYAPARRAISDLLFADGKLAKLHARAVDWRHGRFRQLMQQDQYRTLFSRLMMTPSSRLISPTTAQTLAGFAALARQAGPDPQDSADG
ncbi:glycosyltransferase family 2 protein [Phaeobacter italicus]|uniref:glycosyltransferase family 2 protein n=1 Tax=Phaeobacter italicus TaxID=481446 RepID=UPI001CD74E40|nr:glycosyltransferase family 2 protein [Phaeobacter italicus]MCA0856670.1 glycosyltransferase family 2 protein [Phaeobacter italicus]